MSFHQRQAFTRKAIKVSTVLIIEIDDPEIEARVREWGAGKTAAQIKSRGCLQTMRKLTIQSIDERNARLMAEGKEYEAYVDQWTRPELNESIGNMVVDDPFKNMVADDPSNPDNKDLEHG